MNTPASQAAEMDALVAQAHALRHTDARAALALAEHAHTLALACDHQRGLAYALLRHVPGLRLCFGIQPAGR